MELLFLGNHNRTQEATEANETSSRSHAILQIIVEAQDKVSGTTTEITIGKLSLIDLAGSERAAKMIANNLTTQNISSDKINKGLRLQESVNINKSLLSLGN